MKRALFMGAALMLSSSGAYALDDAAVAEQLKAMQQQINALQAQVGALKRELAQANDKASSAQKSASEAKTKVAEKRPSSGSDVKVSLSPGPKFETADGEYSFKVGGFAQVDAGVFDGDRRGYPDGTTLRRARLNASGTIAKIFNYKIENDFANNASALTDAFIEYAEFKPATLTIGQFKEPFGLETLTGDLFTSFTERASVVAFSPDRKIGAMLASSGDAPIGKWSAALGGFGDGTGVASTDDEAHDATGRLTWAAIADKTQALHFGIAGSYRIPDSAGDAMTFSSRPESQLSNSLLAVNTGSITNINHVSLLGLEAAGVWGPASLQGEFVRAAVDRRNAVDPAFDGYYIEGSYFLTGESRKYVAEQGKFDRVKPEWPFSLKEGHWGAWQAMARLSNLDLNDATVHGGEMKNVTLGVKWYPHANVAVLANYIRVNTDAYSVVPNDDPNIWVIRTQFDF